MNSCCIIVCVLALVAMVQSERTGPHRNHRGLQHHSSIIENAYLLSAGTLKREPRTEKVDGDDGNTTATADANVEVPVKTAKTMESNTSTKNASDKKSSKASDKGLSSDKKDDSITTGQSTENDDNTTVSKSKEVSGNITVVESKQKKGKGASTKRPKSSKGCRRRVESNGEKRSKGAPKKKVPDKTSSSSSKGSNKLTKSDSDNDNGDHSGGGNHTDNKNKSKSDKSSTFGDDSGGVSNHTDYKSKSKSAKGYSHDDGDDDEDHKMEKSAKYPDDTDFGDDLGGASNHTDAKSKTKSAKDYSHDDDDDEDHKMEKSEKYPDDTDECEEETDIPAPTRVPSPGIPSAEEDIDILLSPYFVLYDIEQTRIPLLSDYDELGNFTSGYLDNYFRSAFANMAEIFYVGSRTAVLESEFRLAQAVRIDYATNVTFTSTSLIPATSELESITLGAFEGINGEAYAAAVASGVGEHNIFSTTSAVSYAIVQSSSNVDSRDGSPRVGSMIFAINAGLIAMAVLVHQWRSRKASILITKAINGGKSLVDEASAAEGTKSVKDEQQQMRNIIEGWKAGLVPVLSSMKCSIVSSVRPKRNSWRGFAYQTVESEKNGAPPQTCSGT